MVVDDLDTLARVPIGVRVQRRRKRGLRVSWDRRPFHERLPSEQVDLGLHWSGTVWWHRPSGLLKLFVLVSLRSNGDGTRPGPSSPRLGRQFLVACPNKVRATMVSVVDAVASLLIGRRTPALDRPWETKVTLFAHR